MMTRPESDFVVDGIDHLLAAINDARSDAQKRYKFRRLSQDAFIKASIIGTDFQTVKLTPEDSGTDLVVRNIEKVFTFQTRTIAAGTTYDKMAEVDFRTERQLTNSIPYAGASNTNYERYCGDSCMMLAWTKGDKFFVTSDSDIWLMVEVIRWLPELADGGSEDFFLKYAPEWLLWASMQCLNGYLKEDQRMVISERKLANAWEAFTNFDSETTNSNDSNDLD